jgi:hypothetical protein
VRDAAACATPAGLQESVLAAPQTSRELRVFRAKPSLVASIGPWQAKSSALILAVAICAGDSSQRHEAFQAMPGSQRSSALGHGDKQSVACYSVPDEGCM